MTQSRSLLSPKFPTPPSPSLTLSLQPRNVTPRSQSQYSNGEAYKPACLLLPSLRADVLNINAGGKPVPSLARAGDVAHMGLSSMPQAPRSSSTPLAAATRSTCRHALRTAAMICFLFVRALLTPATVLLLICASANHDSNDFFFCWFVLQRC